MEASAKITRKMIISVPVETMAPLRIASGFDDGVTDILILKDKHNVPFIPGTSLAGVLRSTLENIYGAAVADKFFGSISDDGNQSMVNIADIELQNPKYIYRDGVAIDAFAGVGIPGAKYDYEAVERGAKGQFYLELTERENDKVSYAKLNLSYNHATYANKGDVSGEVMATLADVLAAGFSVGSLTAKGFGKLQANSAAEVKAFDFTNNSGLKVWLNYLENGKLPGSGIYKGVADNVLKVAKQELFVEAEFALTSSMIIRDMEAAQEQSTDAEKLAAVQMTSGSDYVIPGTSVKGVLRNKAKKIMTALATGAGVAVGEELLSKLMGYATKTQAAKSRLSVEEIYIPKDLLAAVKHSRNRIDRLTGGTIDSALFTEKPVWQQNKEAEPITMRLKVERCSPAEAGLVMLLLKDLWLGNLPIGGGKSIGRGVLRGKSCRINYDGAEYKLSGSDKLTITGDKAKLEQYVKDLGVLVRG